MFAPMPTTSQPASRDKLFRASQDPRRSHSRARARVLKHASGGDKVLALSPTVRSQRDRRSGRSQSFCWIHVGSGSWVNRMLFPWNVEWGKDCFIPSWPHGAHKQCRLSSPHSCHEAATNLQQHVNGLPVAQRQSSELQPGHWVF